jgi:hypothetical protein
VLQWLFVPGVAVVVLSGIGWDLIVQGIAPRWVGGLLNLVTSMGFACVMISCLAPRSGARAAVILCRSIRWSHFCHNPGVAVAGVNFQL